MNKLTKSFGIAIIMMLIVAGLNAQNGKKKNGSKGNPIMKYSDQLDLSAEQKSALWDLKMEIKEERKDKLTEDAKPSREERERMKQEKMEEMKAKVANILTEEQNTQLNELIAADVSLRNAKKEEMKARREEAKATRDEYHSEKIEPVLQPLRAEFENELSAEEKATIAKARSLKEERTKHSQEKKGRKEDAFAKNKDDRKLKKELKAIVDNHKDALNVIWEETAENREEWKANMAKIKEEMKKKDKEKKGKHGDRMKSKGPKGHSTLSKIQFLLMPID